MTFRIICGTESNNWWSYKLLDSSATVKQAEVRIDEYGPNGENENVRKDIAKGEGVVMPYCFGEAKGVLVFSPNP